MRMLNTKKKTRIAAATMAMVAIGGTAFAYWTATGSGAGDATTASSSQAVTINQTTTDFSALAPGGSVPLSGTFDNPNSSEVTVAGVAATIASVKKAGVVVTDDCAHDYSITGAAVLDSNQIAAGTGVGGWHGLSITMADSGVNQDVCKGATVAITYATS